MPIYRRANSRFLWLKWTDAQGIEHKESSETEDEAEARALLAEIRRQEHAKVAKAPPGSLTVARFFEATWLGLRKTRKPYAWKTDASRMRHHFLPKFGGRALADLATDGGEVEVLDWLESLPSHIAQRRRGTKLAPRTVWNVASIVRVFFGDALERHVISRDPCAIWRADKHLPAKVDKEKGWRARAGFTLEQVVTLTTDERIPEDRRMLYALRFLGGGLRPSSEANARWRDLDRTMRPLWRLTISSAFDSTNGVEKDTTKTGVDIQVPIHPVLQRLLEEWWAEGWERFMGRPPTSEDFLLPREDGAQRRVWTTLDRFHGDLDAVGLSRQRQYENRSTFRNLALRNGASEFHVNLITHPKPRQASDLYTRPEMHWPQMCAAVECIDARAWDDPSGGLQRGATAYGLKRKTPCNWTRLQGVQMVTPTGLEPMSST